LNVTCISATDLRADRRALAHARALGEAGHRVTLFGVLSPGCEPEEDHGPVVLVRVPVEDAPRARLDASGAFAMLRGSRRLRPLVGAAVERSRVDVIHAFGVDVAGEAADAAQRIGVPLVLDDVGASQSRELGRSVECLDSGARRQLLRRLVAHTRRREEALQRRLRTRRLAMVVTSTPQLAADLSTRFGGATPLVVRDCFATPRRTDAHRLRVRLGTFPGERLIAFRGDDGPGSGAEAAVRALPILGDGHVLVFVGLAQPSEAIGRLAREVGVTSRLRYVVPKSERDTIELLGSADVAVLPGEPRDRIDGLSLPPALFECLASGLPVAASDLPAVGALVRDSGAGVLFTARRPTDPGALAEALRTLLSDASLAAICRDRALSVATSELTWGQESQRLVEAYDHVCQIA
jgi:glycosyltransferase involved in cell wall biosynthesis